MHLPKYTASLALWVGGITGPNSSDDEAENAVVVNGTRLTI